MFLLNGETNYSFFGFIASVYCMCLFEKMEFYFEKVCK